MCENSSTFLDVFTDVSLSCGPVTLVVPTLAQTVELARLVHNGLFAPGEANTVGSWYDSRHLTTTARSVVAKQMEAWRPTEQSRISLRFAIVVDGQVVGVQSLGDTNAGPFRVSGELDTGSWLAPHMRGKRLAVPARLCALHLAFDVLGAHAVVSEALTENVASKQVSLRCGYVDDGRGIDTTGGCTCLHLKAFPAQ